MSTRYLKVSVFVAVSYPQQYCNIYGKSIIQVPSPSFFMTSCEEGKKKVYSDHACVSCTMLSFPFPLPFMRAWT